jgi:predicted DNA-binding transcriptional regulator YafY
MPTGDADTKAARQTLLLRLFDRHPGRAWAVAELAKELGYTTRTIQRDIAELEANGRLPLVTDGEGPATRYRLMEDGRVHLGALHLNVREGMALYLAARLLAQQTDEYNLHVMNALDKLIAAMPAHSTGMLTELVQATAVRQSRDTDFSARFSALVLGWAEQKAVQVRYRPARAPSAYTCTVHPYLFEPSGIGRTIYVIGHVTPHGALRTFKLERIQHATLLDERFAIPADFNGAALLARAWGVMYGDEEPAQVRLRFTRYVAERVKETVWHPSQRIIDLPDGGCEWEASIGDVLEISPWVRGWGSDCEVLAPEGLREDVVRHVRRLARRYGLATTSRQSDLGQLSTDEQTLLNQLFTKTDEEE